MLEKIGLPAKPSLRGNTWVVDASHCQGCSSQFTFINRKHHCRRCGGIFCNSCTQQRMYLRGQGDSPVRVCDPCKKLEEAARFELRHGHRNRAGKGSSRSTLKNEDEVLAQLLASDMKGSSSSGSSLPDEADSNLDRTASATSFSEVASTSSAPSEMGSSTPEELRQQASEEKKKYKVLKAEGKPEEALKAFKRGKELERQADALEIYLRKNRKKVAFSAGNMSENPNPNPTGDGSTRSRSKNLPRDGADTGKDDLMAELKELGWSELDLQSEEKKSGNMSIEGELSALIGEVSEKTNISKGGRGIEQTEITAYKRKALMLKREGKLAEAKEELKKAKLLEKQAEEQEILGGAEDSSDDEFSDLIRSMNENKQENLSSARGHGQFDGLMGVGDIDNIGVDLNFEVTEDDMEDPDLTAALKSLGWAEESNQVDDFSSIRATSRENHAARISNASSSSVVKKPRRSKAEIQRELLGLKRKALSLRREGKAEEAEEVLKAAKELEDEIAELDAPKTTHTRVETTHTRVEPPVNSSVGEVHEEEVTENDLQDPSLLGMLKDLGWQDEDRQEAVKLQDQPLQGSSEFNIQSKEVTKAPRSKAKIQRELLGLKRKALELRRKGQMEEAEEVLKKAKVLEEEMEEHEAAPTEQKPDVSEETKAEFSKLAAPSGIAVDAVKVAAKPITSISENPQSIETTKTFVEELSGFSNIRQNNASVHMADLLTGDDDWRTPPAHDQKPPYAISSSSEHPDARPPTQISPVKSSPEKDISAEKRPQVVESNMVQETAHQKTLSPLKQEILEHKKKAVSLKREGRLAEAREELKRAKLLEKSLNEEQPQPQPSLTTSSSPAVPSSSAISFVREKELHPQAAPKPLTGRERFKIQQESLGHKRQALKLRKEGRIQEAEAEFELAKALEAQLEESGPNDSGKSSSGGADDVVVEDLLDPELLSALKAIGIEDSSTASRIPEKPKAESVKVNAGRSDSSSSSSRERSQLEEEIRAEKLKALNLKRSGKQAEALDALRHAKMLEKKLNA